MILFKNVENYDKCCSFESEKENKITIESFENDFCKQYANFEEI